MSQLVTNTGKLSAKPSRAGTSLASAFYYEPEPFAATNPAILMLVVEVHGPAEEAATVIDILKDCFGEQYYQQRPMSETINHTEQFEAAIRSSNQALTQYARSSSGAWRGKVNAVAAAIAGPELIIASAGSAKAWLYRGNGVTDIGGDSQPGPEQEVFSELIEGSLKAGDKLVITTPALMHHLPSAALDELITDNSPPSAIQKLASQLRGQADTHRLATLIIELTTPDLLVLQDTLGSLHQIELGLAETARHRLSSSLLPLMRKSQQGATHLAKRGIYSFKTQVIPITVRGSKATARAVASGTKAGVHKLKNLRKKS